MAAINIVKRLQSAKIQIVTSKEPDIIRHIVSTMRPDVLKRLSTPPKCLKKGQGKGGNTNYSESIIISAFKALKVRGTKFHPNGSQRPPDILLGGKYKVELKSVKNISSKFIFNDSIPCPATHYCLYARSNRRVLALPGDILLLALDRELVEDVHELVTTARKRGMTRKEDGLAYFYPRQNLFIRNFLHATPVNGYYDFDRNTIWVPEV